MSVYSMQINFDESDLPKTILSDVSEIIAKSFCQNCQNISGSLLHNVGLMLHGEVGPAVFLTIQTITDLNYELNEKCCNLLDQYFTSKTNISKERICIYFTEKVLSDVAVGGQLLLKQIE